MLKLILFGIGMIFVFEGLIYFFFAKKLKQIFETLSYLKYEKIRNFSLILIILGLCFIYLVLKDYKI